MDVGAIINKPASGATPASTSKAQENQDRFLTLLVAQMKNQDPMNPMENAQLTTQIAQIQTVTGIEHLNDSIGKMTQQSAAAQAMQGVALIGHSVTMAGKQMAIFSAHAEGSFEIAGAADQIEVEITTAAGTVVDRISLGAAGAGKHDFVWDRAGIDPRAELNFNVVATRGSKPVKVETFSRDTVVAVNTQGGTLGFQLASGRSVGYDAILTVD